MKKEDFAGCTVLQENRKEEIKMKTFNNIGIDEKSFLCEVRILDYHRFTKAAYEKLLEEQV